LLQVFGGRGMREQDDQYHPAPRAGCGQRQQRVDAHMQRLAHREGMIRPADRLDRPRRHRQQQ
jgi:hypothetical protein